MITFGNILGGIGTGLAAVFGGGKKKAEAAAKEKQYQDMIAQNRQFQSQMLLLSQKQSVQAPPGFNIMKILPILLIGVAVFAMLFFFMRRRT